MTTAHAVADRDGLAIWLSRRWAEPVEVTIVDYSTAGARRRNVVFDVDGSHSGRFVATILPTADIGLISMADEAAVRTLARDNGVPVPEMIGVSCDDQIVGGAFFVSEFVCGETIPRRLLRLVESVGTGEHVVEQIGRAFARLHDIDVELAPAALERSTTPVATALNTLTESIEELAQPEPAFAWGLRWLREHQPCEPSRQAIVHADVRTGNIIVDNSGLRAILDWETSKVGDPTEDLAWVCMRMWRFGRDDLIVGGLASIDVLRRAYLEVGREWDAARFTWWRVLTTLRWGTGLAGQAAAHLDGTFPSIVMAASGRRVSEIAYDVLTMTTPAGADPHVDSRDPTATTASKPMR